MAPIETRMRNPFHPHNVNDSQRPDPKLAEQVVNLNRQLEGGIKERDIAQRALASTKKQPPSVDTGAAGPIAWNDYFYWGLLVRGDVAPTFIQF